ncbi:MAG: toll/interleukin-1 receptor domain-containing protein [Bacillota bacterium]
MEEPLKSPKVFISYSWTSKKHQEWVLELAKRLKSSGIEVILDVWHLKVGHDKHWFMEQIQSDAVDKVLIICDKSYMDKANNRVGGVGNETQIITPSVFEDVKQEKFIPIISERDISGNDYIPTFIKTRMYIDLSNTEQYEENLESLIRNLYNAPQYREPALGKPPAFLFENEIDHYETKTVLRKMRNAIENHPTRIDFLSEEFIDAFIECLNELQISNESIQDVNILDELVKDKIDQSLPLRDDFLEFLKILIESDKLDSEIFVEIFERMFVYTDNPPGIQYSYETQLDQFKFLLHEIVLHTFLFLFKYRKFNIITELLDGEYDLREGRLSNLYEFRFYLPSLESLNSKLKLNKISYHADVLIQRSKKVKQELINTDLLLFHLLRIRHPRNYWFPVTYVYNKYNLPNIKFYSKLKSEKYTEGVLSVFGLKSIEELRDRIERFGDSVGFQNAFDKAPTPVRFIKPEEIATKI